MKDQASTLSLPGVGKKIALLLERLGIFTLFDLLMHLPMRYQDRSKITPIKFAKPHEFAVIEGVVREVKIYQRGKTQGLCMLSDGSGRLNMRFFKLFPNQRQMLVIGTELRVMGVVKFGPTGLEMVHPEISLLKQSLVDALTPFYPATEGISQNLLRKLTAGALKQLDRLEIKELLPEAIRAMHEWPTLHDTIQFMHAPPPKADLHKLQSFSTPFHERLIFEELLAHRIMMQNTKSIFKTRQSIPLAKKSCLEDFKKALPFELTDAQTRVIGEISEDLTKPVPMLRLLQGDVGSGKTIVAACAMLQTVACGYQAALMAPTELLAEQHYHSFRHWLKPLGLHVQFLSGAKTGKKKQKTLDEIELGASNVVIGTHALFQQAVQFERLALIVIDEQHRFGVAQRAQLLEKGREAGAIPHQLILSATPIPRTLAMTFYADLDCSTINELPKGRTKIETFVLPNARRDDVIDRIKSGSLAGRQVYWVCPLIEESEVLNSQAALNMAELLQAALPDHAIGLVHGRMKAKEKTEVMLAFKNGNIDILVATTVIEVGVDVPNASLMVIENAERLGLSQLHQLRGRVGRGSTASYCVLLYQAPLSERAKARLETIRETTDGFKIAEKDLELRGAGEIFGTRQTGEIAFRIADLVRDNHLLPRVQDAAEVIMAHHADLVPHLIDRWLNRSHGDLKV